MGAKMKVQTERDAEYLKSLMGLTRLLVHRILRPWLQPNLIWKLSPFGWEEKGYLKTLHSFTDSVIKDRKAKLQKNLEILERLQSASKFRLAFLDLILQSQMRNDSTSFKMSDIDIRSETDLFLAAGHDTSGSALSWTLFALAHNPEIQRKVQNELDKIFEDDGERKVTNEDLTKMQYLEMCFKEALRLRPPIPFIMRQLYKDLELRKWFENKLI